MESVREESREGVEGRGWRGLGKGNREEVRDLTLVHQQETVMKHSRRWPCLSDYTGNIRIRGMYSTVLVTASFSPPLSGV